jgi:hypothetical protein
LPDEDIALVEKWVKALKAEDQRRGERKQLRGPSINGNRGEVPGN